MYIYTQKDAHETPNLDGLMVKPPAMLSFNFFLTNRLPVWVMNNSRPKGKIVLQMSLPNGKTKPVFIERTTLPMCITDEVGHEMIENGSQDLRMYVNKGMLTLVWPGDAISMVGTPEALEELARIRNSEFSANATIVSQRVEDMQKETILTDTSLQAGSVLANEINPRVMDFVARFNSDDIQVKDAVGELKVMEDELSSKDLSYIVANISNGKAKKFAQNLLAQAQVRETKGKTTTKSSSSKEDEYDITKGTDSDLTQEERDREAVREAQARQFQKL